MKLTFNLITLSILILQASCVSLNISETELKKSDHITFGYELKNFKALSNPGFDFYWQHSKGNSVTIKSNCNDEADPSLEQLERQSLIQLDFVKNLKTEKIFFNSRESIHSIKKMKLDGVNILVELYVLKKNSCNYVISYLSVEKYFNEHKKEFDKFIAKLGIY